MVPTQLITKILQCMYLKQQAINTAERGLVHEVMTHCEGSMCPLGHPPLRFCHGQM